MAAGEEHAINVEKHKNNPPKDDERPEYRSEKIKRLFHNVKIKQIFGFAKYF